ncbi:hypothetical protein D3C72_1387850 [compost metagenome]
MQHREVLFRQRNGREARRRQPARAQFQHPGVGRQRGGRIAQAPRQRRQRGRQFIEVGRLRQVVVGADVQPRHAVAGAAARRQHDDAQALAAFAQLADQRQAVAVGQPEVDQRDAVAGRVVGAVEAFERRLGIDPVAAAGQELAQLFAQHGFIFQQDHITHGNRVGAGDRGNLSVSKRGEVRADSRCGLDNPRP